MSETNTPVLTREKVDPRYAAFMIKVKELMDEAPALGLHIAIKITEAKK